MLAIINRHRRKKWDRIHRGLICLEHVRLYKVKHFSPAWFLGATMAAFTLQPRSGGGKQWHFSNLLNPEPFVIQNTLSKSALLDIVWEILPWKVTPGNLSSLLSNSQSLPLAPEPPLNWGAPIPPGQGQMNP